MTARTNYLFREDCRKTIKRKLLYHYVWTSPPDYNEIGLRPIKDDETYVSFLSSIYSALNPKNGLITLLVSDRKYKGNIIPRHKIITEMMCDLGYNILTHKIWVKSNSRSLFFLQYAHIITFGTGKHLGQKQREDAYDTDEFHLDVFFDKQGKDKHSQPATLITKCILAHTKKHQVVFDPFIGRGSTAGASVDCKRYFIGSELDKDKHLETKRLLKKSGVKFLTRM
jgi:DNA modification methylase